MPGARTAALILGLAVALGAMGAHALEDLLEANDRLDVWQTAVFYMVTHGLALWLNANSRRPDQFAAWCFVVGVVIFSGSLYLLAVTNIRWLGAITPIGGVAFLVGWGRLLFRRNDKAGHE